MMKRWKHKTPHLRRKTKSEALFVFKLMMCSSSMNNVILCLFLVVFILCFVEQCVLWCYVLYSVFYVMFVILMFVFNFNVFVHHCSRIFRFFSKKKKRVTRPCRICTRPCDLTVAKIKIFSVLVYLLSSNEDIV